MLTTLLLSSILMVSGVSKKDSLTLSCIANYESKMNPIATHKNKNKTKDYGLFQINSIWLGRCLSNTRQILSVDTNLKCAKLILKIQGLRAWSTYKFCRSIPMPSN